MAQLSAEQQQAVEEQKAQCPFCKIVKGEIPSKKVYEDDKAIVVLDINPASIGHMLVMPKEHYPIMPLIPKEEFEHLFSVTQNMVRSCHEGILSAGTSIFIANGAAAGQQSSHFMLHVVPREKSDGISAFNIEDKQISEEEGKKLLEPLRNNLGIMMRKHFQSIGKPFPQKMSKEQIIQIVEQNPQLKNLILKSPEEFKKAIPQNNQLKQLFEGQDIDSIIEEVKKKHPKVEEKKEEEKKEEKKEGEADLDTISKLFK
jgi:histidine triad (HIT) family protein